MSDNRYGENEGNCAGMGFSLLSPVVRVVKELRGKIQGSNKGAEAKVRQREEVSDSSGDQSGRKVAIIVTIIAIAFAFFHLYSALYSVLPKIQQTSIHLAFILVLVYLLHPTAKRGGHEGWHALDISLILIGVAACLYLFFSYFALRERYGTPNIADYILGSMLVLLVIDGTRRAMGWALPLVVIGCLLYAFLGKWMPGMFKHAGYDLGRVVSTMYHSPEGIWALPLYCSATYVVIFILFAAFLKESGAGDFIMDGSRALMGGVRGGPAKLAVVASGAFGTISGSGVANVLATGSMTIPLMKRTGYQPHFAGAVESVASIGGSLMPPVMAATAFIMAEILGVSYWTVCVAAFLPAVLYYIGIFVAVDLEAAKRGLKGEPRENLPKLRPVLARGLHMAIPVVVLLFYLGVLKYSATTAAFWAVVAIVVVSWVRSRTRMSPRRIVRAMEDAARIMPLVALACASAGIVMGVFQLTGLSMRLSTILIDLSGGALFPLLVLAMVASAILGMGLPFVACYIILAILVAPALVQMGIVPIAAHLFVYYFGLMAYITPPVCVSAYVASGIAGAPPMKIGFTAVRLGIAAFILPYVFIYRPSIVGQGEPLEIALTAVAAVIGISALASGLSGWLFTRLTIPERLAMISGAVLVIIPAWLWNLLGLLLLVAVLARQLYARRREKMLVRSEDSFS